MRPVDPWTMTVKEVAVHSHDRTMIASLGFGDGDRKNSEHDLACQYLAEKPTSVHLVSLIAGDDFDAEVHGRLEGLSEEKFVKSGELQYGEQADPRGAGSIPWPEKKHRGLEHSQPRITVSHRTVEVPLSKGEGKYQTTVGFLDVLIGYKIEAGIRGESFAASYAYENPNAYHAHQRGPRIWSHRWGVFADVVSRQGEIAIEVKINPVGIGEAIRQIKFYRSFVGRNTTFVLATRYEISQDDSDLLKAESIHHVHLGRAFGKWTADRAKNSVPSTSSIQL